MASQISNQFIFILLSYTIIIAHSNTNTTFTPSQPTSANSFATIKEQLAIVDPLIWIILGLIMLVCCVCSLFIAFCVAERYLRQYKREFDAADAFRTSSVMSMEPTVSLSSPTKPRKVDKTDSVSIIYQQKPAAQMMPLSRSKSTPTLHNNPRFNNCRTVTTPTIAEISPIDLQPAPPMTKIVRSQSHAAGSSNSVSNTRKFKPRTHQSQANYNINRIAKQPHKHDSEYSNTISDNSHNYDFKRAKTQPMNHPHSQWNYTALQKHQLQSIPSQKASPPMILQQQDQLPPIPPTKTLHRVASLPVHQMRMQSNANQMRIQSPPNQRRLNSPQIMPQYSKQTAPQMSSKAVHSTVPQQYVQSAIYANLQTNRQKMTNVPPQPQIHSPKIQAHPQQKVPQHHVINIMAPHKENPKLDDHASIFSEDETDGIVVKLDDHPSDGIVGMMNMFSNAEASSSKDSGDSDANSY